MQPAAKRAAQDDRPPQNETSHSAREAPNLPDDEEEQPLVYGDDPVAVAQEAVYILQRETKEQELKRCADDAMMGGKVPADVALE